RKRFYFLRSLYLTLLMAMMAIVWVAVTDLFSYSIVYSVSRMAEASKVIVSSIAWFQFIAAQIVAIIICSTAVNSEIYSRTLYVLMTTPITSFQLITGKLLGRLWQIFLLLGISLPLLGMVRVFGGIPWAFLIEALCITLCTVFFISAVALFFSILFRRAYVVIIFTVITLAIIFALVPFMLLITVDAMYFVDDDIIEQLVIHTNPYVMLAFKTDRMFSAFGRLTSLYWLVPCGFMVGSALLILAAGCGIVRKSALKHMTPKSTRKKYKMPSRKSRAYWLHRPFFLHSIIQHTIGTGMIWKEFLHPVLGKFRKVVFIGFILMIASFIISVLSVLAFGELMLFSVIIAGSVISVIALAILFTIIIPATYITSEKESGTWLILLTTCYSDTQILGGKIVGILRRIVIVWSPFLLIYYLAAYFSDNPISMFLTLMLALSSAIGFIIASGLYFSSRFKHTTTAVICNLSLAAILWAGIPGILLMLEELSYATSGPLEYFFHYADDFLRLYWALIPPGMILNIMESNLSSRYYGFGLSFSTLLIIYTIIHLFAILFCLWRTKANLRKRIV
ncbi:MAG: hypothetical protein ABFR90_11335, partial [Planctomycetota bacterium]